MDKAEIVRIVEDYARLASRAMELAGFELTLRNLDPTGLYRYWRNYEPRDVAPGDFDYEKGIVTVWAECYCCGDLDTRTVEISFDKLWDEDYRSALLDMARTVREDRNNAIAEREAQKQAKAEDTERETYERLRAKYG